MMKQACYPMPFLVSLALLSGGTQASAQTKEKVYRTLSPAQIESAMKEMNIKFTKTPTAKRETEFNYDYDRNTFKIRLTVSEGKRLWLSALFPKVSLETINKWNINATFSRAVLYHDADKDKDYSVVEYQIDGNGGCTEGMLKQFIRRFDEEVTAFDQFLRN
jgi:hypothetical protein